MPLKNQQDHSLPRQSPSAGNRDSVCSSCGTASISKGLCPSCGSSTFSKSNDEIMKKVVDDNDLIK
jgi:ribosomal protein L32